MRGRLAFLTLPNPQKKRKNRYGWRLLRDVSHGLYLQSRVDIAQSNQHLRKQLTGDIEHYCLKTHTGLYNVHSPSGIFIAVLWKKKMDVRKG